MFGEQELELYSYELADGTRGTTSAHSVLEVHEQLQGRGVQTVHEIGSDLQGNYWGSVKIRSRK